MREIKIIKISSCFLHDLLKSIFISILVIFLIEHFGHFKYENWAFDNNFVSFETVFNNVVYSETNIFTSNKLPIYPEVESYSEKFPYYLFAVILDFIPLLITILVVLAIFRIRRNYRFKIV
jgi:hypothetical protein